MFLEAPVDFQLTIRRYIPEDSTLHNHRCENLKSWIAFSLFPRSKHPGSNELQTFRRVVRQQTL
jgi:hypothetical protein